MAVVDQLPPTPPPCGSALHLILLLVLSMLVVRQRRKHKVALGDGGMPAAGPGRHPRLRQRHRIRPRRPGRPGGAGGGRRTAAVVHIIGAAAVRGPRDPRLRPVAQRRGLVPRAVGVIATWIAYVLGRGAAVSTRCRERCSGCHAVGHIAAMDENLLQDVDRRRAARRRRRRRGRSAPSAKRSPSACAWAPWKRSSARNPRPRPARLRRQAPGDGLRLGHLAPRRAPS